MSLAYWMLSGAGRPLWRRTGCPVSRRRPPRRGLTASGELALAPLWTPHRWGRSCWSRGVLDVRMDITEGGS
ncbi:hypothetical protein QJS66_22005 [Kocuria rhizophila]|nr:hypothetical protein QJS66_22005 [Kocuria rhizophila]